MAALSPPLENYGTIHKVGLIDYSSGETIHYRKVNRLLEPTMPEEDELKSDAEEENLSLKTTPEEDPLQKPESSLAREQTTTEVEVEEGAPIVTSWTRGDRIAAILLRPETIRILEIIDQPDLEACKVEFFHFVLESQQNLHAFADLASEDLLSVEDGLPILTPLAERMIEQVVRL